MPESCNGRGHALSGRIAKQSDQLLALLVQHRQVFTDDGKRFRLNPLLATAATEPVDPNQHRGDKLATPGDMLVSMAGK